MASGDHAGLCKCQTSAARGPQDWTWGRPTLGVRPGSCTRPTVHPYPFGTGVALQLSLYVKS